MNEKRDILGALLWARNQIDCGQVPAAEVLKRLDRVLDAYDVSVGDFRAFQEKFPRGDVAATSPKVKDDDSAFAFRCIPRLT